MARPLRLEYPGAIYHLTSRGDRREAIYEDDNDRLQLKLRGQVFPNHIDATILPQWQDLYD